MVLYRPIGHKELELIVEAGLKGYPPRLPDQPTFYPVLNASYAREIAEGWNTKSDTFAGYITRFNLDNDYFGKFDIQVVGAGKHKEIWVPAGELDEFNSHILGHIDVIAAYFGDNFVGTSLEHFYTKKTGTAAEYLQLLLATYEYNGMDFLGAIVMNYKSVFCNFAYWKQVALTRLEAEQNSRASSLVPAIIHAWYSNFPGIDLPTECRVSDSERGAIA